MLRPKNRANYVIRACMRTCSEVQRHTSPMRRGLPKHAPLPFYARLRRFTARYSARELVLGCLVGAYVCDQKTGFRVFFFFRVMPSRSIFWCAVFCLDNQHLWTERVVSTGDELTLLKLDMVTDLPAVTGPIAKASACRVGRHHAAETKKKEQRHTSTWGARGH